MIHYISTRILILCIAAMVFTNILSAGEFISNVVTVPKAGATTGDFSVIHESRGTGENSASFVYLDFHVFGHMITKEDIETGRVKIILMTRHEGNGQWFRSGFDTGDFGWGRLYNILDLQSDLNTVWIKGLNGAIRPLSGRNKTEQASRIIFLTKNWSVDRPRQFKLSIIAYLAPDWISTEIDNNYKPANGFYSQELLDLLNAGGAPCGGRPQQVIEIIGYCRNSIPR